jgi:uncharacterized protein DUF2786
VGKNNRQRRAAKVRKRSQVHGSRHDTDRNDEPPWAEQSSMTVGEAFSAAVRAEQIGDDATVGRAVDVLVNAPEREVAVAVAGLLEQQVAEVWSWGWQPADLVRVVDRKRDRVGSALVRWVVASEATSYEELGSRVAPAWMAQLERMDATRNWDPCRPYLLQSSGSRDDALRAAVRLMRLFLRLAAVPLLTDPPRAWREGPIADPGSLPDGLLDKVRALLAKAESTTFDAEADACTAKAQALMAQHRIDRALLDAGRVRRADAPGGRRIPVDDPYADAKAVLLTNVADANGCRAVWSKPMGFMTVFGFADELDAVEELFTSLLVQAVAALRREGSKQDRWGRSRTTRFRRSFLLAFAVRIGERLRETVDATVDAADADSGHALVPILAARADETRAAVEAAFPDAHSFSPSATDGEGWFAGTVFGDLADLSVQAELAKPPV